MCFYSWPTLADAAHTIKGAVGSFSAGPASQAALRLEEVAAEGDLTAASEALDTLKQELNRLRPVLAGFLLEYAN